MAVYDPRLDNLKRDIANRGLSPSVQTLASILKPNSPSNVVRKDWTADDAQRNAPEPSGWAGFVYDVLKNPIVKAGLTGLSALSIPMRITLAHVDEVTDFLDRNPETTASWNDFVAHVKDPEYGFGKVWVEPFGDSNKGFWQKWGNRTVGLAGDIVYDPLTYVTLGANKAALLTGDVLLTATAKIAAAEAAGTITKKAAAEAMTRLTTKGIRVTGRTGRLELAQRLTDAGSSPQVIQDALHWGRSRVPEADLVAANVQQAGLYFMGKRIGGTVASKTGRKLERGIQTMSTWVGDTAFGKFADGFADLSTKQISRALARGTAPLDQTAAYLSAIMAHSGERVGAAEASRKAGQLYLVGRQLIPDFDDKYAKYGATVYKYLDTAEGKVALAAASPEEQEFAALFEGLLERLNNIGRDASLAIDKDAPWGTVDHYFPHMLADKAGQFIKDSADVTVQRLRNVVFDPGEKTGAFKSRMKKGDIFFGEEVSQDTIDAGIDGLNAHARLHGKIDFDFFEVDIDKVMQKYITQHGTEMGKIARRRILVERGVFEAIGEQVVEDPVFMKAMEKRLKAQLAAREASLKKVTKTIDDVAKKVQEGLQRSADDALRDLESMKLRPWADAEAKLKLAQERAQIEIRLDEIIEEMRMRRQDYLTATGADGLLIKAADDEVNALLKQVLAAKDDVLAQKFNVDSTNDMLLSLKKALETVQKFDAKMVERSNILNEQIEGVVAGLVDSADFRAQGHVTFVNKLNKALDYMWIATDRRALKGVQGREASIDLDWIDNTATSAHKTVMGVNAKGEEFNIFDEATRLVNNAEKKANRAGETGQFPRVPQLKKTFKKLYLQSEKRAGRLDGEETLKQYVDEFATEAREAIASKIIADPTYLAMMDHVRTNIASIQAYGNVDTYQRVLKNIGEGRATDEELRSFGLALVVSDDGQSNIALRNAILENAANERYRKLVTAKRQGKGLAMSAQETYDNYNSVVNAFEDAVLFHVEYQRLTPYNIVRDFGDDIVRAAKLSPEKEDMLRDALLLASDEIDAATILRGLEIDEDLLVKIFGANEEMFRGNVVYRGNRAGFNQIADDIMEKFSTQMSTLDMMNAGDVRYSAFGVGGSSGSGVSTWGELIDYAAERAAQYGRVSLDMEETAEGFARAVTKKKTGTLSVEQFLRNQAQAARFADDVFEDARRQGSAKVTKISDALKEKLQVYYDEPPVGQPSITNLIEIAKRDIAETQIRFYDSEGGREIKIAQGLFSKGEISAEDLAQIKEQVGARQQQKIASIKDPRIDAKGVALKTLPKQKEELAQLIMEQQFAKTVEARMENLTKTLMENNLTPTADMYDAIVVASARATGRQFEDSLIVMQASRTRIAQALEINTADFADNPQGLFAAIMDTLQAGGDSEIHGDVLAMFNDGTDSSHLFGRMFESGSAMSASGEGRSITGLENRIAQAQTRVRQEEELIRRGLPVADEARLISDRALIANPNNKAMIAKMKADFQEEARTWWMTYIDRSAKRTSITKKMISDRLRENEALRKVEAARGASRGSMTEDSSVADMVRWLKDKEKNITARSSELRKSSTFFTNRMDPFWVKRNLGDANITSRLDNLYLVTRKLEQELKIGRRLETSIIGLEEKLLNMLPEARKQERLLARLTSTNPRDHIFVANTKPGERMLDEVAYAKALAEFDEPDDVAKMDFDAAKKWRADNTRKKNAFIAEAEAGEALAMKQRDKMLMDTRDASLALDNFKTSPEYYRAVQMRREHDLLKQLAGMDMKQTRNLISTQSPHHLVAEEAYKAGTGTYYRVRPPVEGERLEREIAELYNEIKGIDRYGSTAKADAGRMASEDRKDILDAAAVTDKKQAGELKADKLAKVAELEDQLRRLNHQGDIGRVDDSHVFSSSNEYFTAKANVESTGTIKDKTLQQSVNDIMAALTSARNLYKRVKGKASRNVEWLNPEQKLYSRKGQVIDAITLGDRAELGYNAGYIEKLNELRNTLNAQVRQRRALEATVATGKETPKEIAAKAKLLKSLPKEDALLIDIKNINIAIRKRKDLASETASFGKNVLFDSNGESTLPEDIRLLELRLKQSLNTTTSAKTPLRWAPGTNIGQGIDEATGKLLDVSGMNIEFTSLEIDAMLNSRYHLTSESSRTEFIKFANEKLKEASAELAKFGTRLDAATAGTGSMSKRAADIFLKNAKDFVEGKLGDPTPALNRHVSQAEMLEKALLDEIKVKWAAFEKTFNATEVGKPNLMSRPYLMRQKYAKALVDKNKEIARVKAATEDVRRAGVATLEAYKTQVAEGMSLKQIMDARAAEKLRWEEMGTHWTSGMKKVQAMVGNQQDDLTQQFLAGKVTPRNMVRDPAKSAGTQKWLDDLWAKSVESDSIAHADKLAKYEGKQNYKNMVATAKDIATQLDDTRKKIAAIKGLRDDITDEAPFGFKVDRVERARLKYADRDNLQQLTNAELEATARRPIVSTDMTPPDVVYKKGKGFVDVVGTEPGVDANTIPAHKFRLPELEKKLNETLDAITDGTNGRYDARTRYNELLLGDGTPEGGLSVREVYKALEREVNELSIVDYDIAIPQQINKFFGDMNAQSAIEDRIGYFTKIMDEEQAVLTRLQGVSDELNAQFKELETLTKATTGDTRKNFGKAYKDFYTEQNKSIVKRWKQEQLLMDNAAKYQSEALIWESERQLNIKMIAEYRAPLEARLAEITALLARTKAVQSSTSPLSARFVEMEGIIQDAQEMLYVKGSYGETEAYTMYPITGNDTAMKPRIAGIIPEGFGKDANRNSKVLKTRSEAKASVSAEFEKSLGEVSKREKMLAANLETLKIAYLTHSAKMTTSYKETARFYDALAGGKFFEVGSDLNGRSGTKIVEQLNDGWKKLTDNGMPNLQMRKDLEDMIFNLNKFTEPGFVQDVNKFLARYTRLLKSYVLANPGYVVRNSMTNTFTLLAAGTEVKNMITGMKIWMQMQDALKTGKYEEWLDNLAVDVKDDVVTAIQAKDASGFGHIADFMTSAPVGKRKQGMYDNWWLRLHQKANQKSEDSARFMMAFDSARKGHSVEGAAGRVKRFLFDYSAKGSFDKNTSHIMPFWFWTTRNFPMQLQNKWQNPRAYLTYNKIVNNMQGERQDDDPQWLREAGGFPIGKSTYLSLDLGFNKLDSELRMLSEPRRILGMVNPAIRAPLDFIAGQNTVYGNDFGTKPQDNMAGPPFGALSELLASVTGQNRGNGQVSPAFNHFYKMLNPIANPMERLNPQTVKGKSNQLGGWLGFAGVPLTPIPPEMRALERQRQVYENQDLRNQGR